VENLIENIQNCAAGIERHSSARDSDGRSPKKQSGLSRFVF
jgi:hypothetical protein